MTNGIKMLAALAAAISLAGCVQEARIAMPSDLAARTERLELSGIGGSGTGSLRIGQSTGRFSRSAEQWALFATTKRTGDGSFSVAGPEVGGELSALCDYGEREVNVSIVSVTTDRLVYSCDFAREGRPIAAKLVLEERQDKVRTLISRRVGSLRFEGQDIGIRSINEFEGGKLPTPSPLGYMFDVGGAEIGAVDLNGSPKIIHAPADPKLRQAMIAASLALAVFWDPADVDPDR